MSSSQTQTLQALSLKQMPVPIQPASLIKHPSQGTPGGKAGPSDSLSEGGKRGDSIVVTEVRAINMSRSVTAVSAQPLIAPGIYRHSVTTQPINLNLFKLDVHPETCSMMLVG